MIENEQYYELRPSQRRRIDVTRELNFRRGWRSKMAREVRELRAMCQSNGVRFTRTQVERLLGLRSAPPKPSFRNLRREAKAAARFAATPIRLGYMESDEYYTRCGAEDAAGARRDAARMLAPILNRAAKLVAAGL